MNWTYPKRHPRMLVDVMEEKMQIREYYLLHNLLKQEAEPRKLVDLKRFAEDR